MTRVPSSNRPSASTVSAADSGIPRCDAARQTSAVSPTGSAAARSKKRRASPGRLASLRLKLSSMLADRGTAAGRPNPPASCVGVNPRGNSNSASGLPRVSATIRSSTCSSSGAGKTDSRSARASRRPKGSMWSSATPVSASISCRAAKKSAIFSARRRRATNASTRAEARSSHCASSTTQRSGCSSAASDNRLRTASPTRNGFGGRPALNPSATSRASRWGSGRCSIRSRLGEHSCWSDAKASSISPSTPTARATRKSDAARTAYSSNAVLPTPGSPYTARTAPCPPRAAASARSSTSRSRRRPCSFSPGALVTIPPACHRGTDYGFQGFDRPWQRPR